MHVKPAMHACTDVMIPEIFPSCFFLLLHVVVLFVLLYVGTAVSLGRHSNGDSS